MYAIIETGGAQYKVQEGSVINIQKTDKKPGETIEFNTVLLLSDGDKVQVGTPYVPDRVVVGEVTRHFKGKKIIVFKKKRRKEYEKTIGHRQHYTEVRIKEIR